MYFRILKQNEMKKTLSILGTILIIYIVVFSCNRIISNNLENNINTLMEANKIQKNELQKMKQNCERELVFDGNNLCFPKFENWKECRIDSNLKAYVDNLELNNKILAFYIPNEIYIKSKTEEILNYPVISLFVHNSTIGMKTTSEALPMVFAGLKNTFIVQDWKYVENILKTKTDAEFINPILFDSFDISSTVKSLVTINSSKQNDSTTQRVSFVNIMDLKSRIIILNYSKSISKNFQYSEMKEENEQIVKKIIEAN